MDLAISSCNLFEHIKGFRGLPQSEMPDHCKLKIIINIDIESSTIQKDDYNWLKLPPYYKWDHSKSDQCKETFDSRCVTEIIQKQHNSKGNSKYYPANIQAGQILIQQIFNCKY